jgi:hypothetical protein
MYIAGVAVESMLRAIRAKQTREFTSRHDVLSLFAECRMLKVGEETLKAKGWRDEDIESHMQSLRTAVNGVYVLWHNNYRYASEDRVAAHLKRLKLFQRAKGDILKSKALELFNAANLFIAKGILQWH